MPAPHRNYLADAARLARLKAHLQVGGSRYSFAKAEGISRQALQDWLARRPDYERQLAGYDRGHKSAPVVGARFWARVEAVRRRKDEGLQWDRAAYPLGITEKALKQWYYLHRETVDGLIAERRAA
jgi:hypothetical protein